MKNPFEILGVAESADDEQINKAYLRKVKEYPPEREPARFQESRTAFETIRTQKDRLRFKWFNQEIPSPETLLAPLLRVDKHQRPSEEVLLNALAASITGKHQG